MALLHRLKQVQLDRSLVLDSNGVADENKPAFLSPTLWFPAAFKVLAAASRSRHLPPQYALFDPFLEHNKALERHRDRVFHTKFLQTLHHRVAEKGAVHAYLQSRRWKAFPDRFDTGGHKFHCAFGIMHVAATVQHIEYLTGLRHGAKQRIVTARSFLFLVKANRRAFGIDLSSKTRTGSAQFLLFLRKCKGLITLSRFLLFVRGVVGSHSITIRCAQGRNPA